MKTIHGLTRVDVIYVAWTTISSTPLPSAPTLWWAYPALMNAYRAGNIALANAVGTGVTTNRLLPCRPSSSIMPGKIRFCRT